MKGVIRLGDKHSHGGSVITASGADFEGKPVMLAGDMVSCSKHGNVSVPAGVASWPMMGKEVVVDGCKASCGCVLYTSLSNAGVA